MQIKFFYWDSKGKKTSLFYVFYLSAVQLKPIQKQRIIICYEWYRNYIQSVLLYYCVCKYEWRAMIFTNVGPWGSLS
jgi:hypothetical protein